MRHHRFPENENRPGLLVTGARGGPLRSLQSGRSSVPACAGGLDGGDSGVSPAFSKYLTHSRSPTRGRKCTHGQTQEQICPLAWPASGERVRSQSPSVCQSSDALPAPGSPRRRDHVRETGKAYCRLRGSAAPVESREAALPPTDRPAPTAPPPPSPHVGAHVRPRGGVGAGGRSGGGQMPTGRRAGAPSRDQQGWAGGDRRERDTEDRAASWRHRPAVVIGKACSPGVPCSDAAIVGRWTGF